jgi:hypothetical protein
VDELPLMSEGVDKEASHESLTGAHAPPPQASSRYAATVMPPKLLEEEASGWPWRPRRGNSGVCKPLPIPHHFQWHTRCLLGHTGSNNHQQHASSTAGPPFACADTRLAMADVDVRGPDA